MECVLCNSSTTTTTTTPAFAASFQDRLARVDTALQAVTARLRQGGLTLAAPTTSAAATHAPAAAAAVTAPAAPFVPATAGTGGRLHVDLPMMVPARPRQSTTTLSVAVADESSITADEPAAGHHHHPRRSTRLSRKL